MNAPILFLHGFMGSRHDWAPLLEHLGPSVEAIAIDLPGHGDNLALPILTPIDIPWMALSVLSILDAHTSEKVHLVGYSMGGRIALHLALHHPERFHSLVMESASPGLSHPQDRRERITADRRRAREIQEDFPAFLQSWYELPLFGSLSSHPAFPEMLQRRHHPDPTILARIIEDMSPGLQPDLTPHLKKLSLPSLWLAGAEDEKYAALMPRCAASCPEGSSKIIAHAGHNLHLQAPNELATLIQSFQQQAS